MDVSRRPPLARRIAGGVGIALFGWLAALPLDAQLPAPQPGTPTVSPTPSLQIQMPPGPPVVVEPVRIEARTPTVDGTLW